MDKILKDFTSRFTTATFGASGNQYAFTSDGKEHTGIIWYKFCRSGEYDFSLLYSNTMDSTFGNGSESVCNFVCDNWEILSLSTAFSEKIQDPARLDFTQLFFDGKPGKKIGAEDVFFNTDPVKIKSVKDEFICIKITFRGSRIPCHEESILSSFLIENGELVSSKRLPFPSMLGIDAHAAKRLCFLGDSITQGIGVPVDSYKHYTALISEKLPPCIACWDLGLGYARANDAATNGVWLSKVKTNTHAVICLGVNDINQGYGADAVISALDKTVDALKSAGLKVLVQTVPPFDYNPENKQKWLKINNHIKTVSAEKADMIFDCVPVLGCGDDLRTAKFGGHPGEEGCRLWADALYPEIEKFLKL